MYGIDHKQFRLPLLLRIWQYHKQIIHFNVGGFDYTSIYVLNQTVCKALPSYLMLYIVYDLFIRVFISFISRMNPVGYE